MLENTIKTLGKEVEQLTQIRNEFIKFLEKLEE
jgi:hypothetical protein